MTGSLLLTLNPGSSTIKFGLFARDGARARRLGKGQVDLRHDPLVLHLEGDGAAELPLRAAVTEDLHAVLDEVLDTLADHFPLGGMAAIGHRVVHGGEEFTGPVRLDPAMLAAIEALVPLAPLHQPQSLRLIRALARLRPELPQTASFDTAFHRAQPMARRRFALPRALHDAGIRRYGFHGLSYRSIAQRLAARGGGLAEGRVVVAHLGSGSSLCALRAGRSEDSSMGFSTLDGVPMGTRCGALDPGVLLHLLGTGLDAAGLSDLLYHRSGLLGVSGLSADTRVLLESDAPEAREALELFTFRIAREVAALATSLGGLDGLVFTAGIGQHQPEIRAAICAHLRWMGVVLDPARNAAGGPELQAGDSAVTVLALPTDEEQVIADEALSVLDGQGLSLPLAAGASPPPRWRHPAAAWRPGCAGAPASRARANGGARLPWPAPGRPGHAASPSGAVAPHCRPPARCAGGTRHPGG